jgi:hypothetical protein
MQGLDYTLRSPPDRPCVELSRDVGKTERPANSILALRVEKSQIRGCLCEGDHFWKAKTPAIRTRPMASV